MNAAVGIAGAWQAPVDIEDLECLYHVFLGRDAEASLREGGFQPRPLAAVALEMATCQEIDQRVLHPLVQEKALPQERLGPVRLKALHEWLTRRLQLPPLADGAYPGAALLLDRAYAHPELLPALQLAHGSLFTEAQAELARRARQPLPGLEGKIEFVNREFISGWMLDPVGRVAQPQLEVRHEGRVVAVGSAHSFRPDIQQRFGGAGLAGFRAPWSPAALPAGRPLVFTLHESGSGQQVGPAYRFENSFVDQLGVAQLLSKELEEIQRRLDVLAGMVPQALSYSAFPLDHYDLFRRTHRVPPPPRLAGAPTVFTVLVDATAAQATAVRITVDSLREQAGDPTWRLHVVGDSAEVADTVAVLAAAQPQVRHLADWDAAAALLAGQSDAEDHWVLLLQAGELLDAQALAWMHAARHQWSVAGLYWDEDRLMHRGGRAPAREPRHVDPILRRPFDADSLLELNIVGTSFAVRAGALRAALGLLAEERGGALSGAARERLVWAVWQQGPWGHVPHFLLSRTDLAERPGEPAGLARLTAQAAPDVLAPLLPPAWRARTWAREPDPLLGPGAKPLVHWRPQSAAGLLSVLIPTRDYGDLLQVCVQSLREQAAQPDRLDIVIADNGSTDPATLAYLAQAQADGLLRCLRIDEPFNWSRLNNQMARAARGDALLFLNNDTRMLTPGWDRILLGLLERPEVAAVGARLLYEDMTIQHAGVVMGREGFFAHDCVGEPVADANSANGSALTRQVPAVTGAFLACRRTVFEQVGPFNEEDLAVTYNDVEWCLRAAQRLPGHPIVYAPAISLVHYESKSRGFDFMDTRRQARATHELDRLLQLQPLSFPVPGTDNPQYSPWTYAAKALR